MTRLGPLHPLQWPEAPWCLGFAGGLVMPVHDWTRVGAGIFHDFHHDWITTLKRALNAGLLPPGYYALAEQIAGGLGPDVLTLDLTPPGAPRPQGATPAAETSGGVALDLAPPK